MISIFFLNNSYHFLISSYSIMLLYVFAVFNGAITSFLPLITLTKNILNLSLFFINNFIWS